MQYLSLLLLLFPLRGFLLLQFLPPRLSCLLPYLLLLVLSPLLLLSTPFFLYWARWLYMGWVWVSLHLLGFPLSPLTRLPLPRIVLPLPLRGHPLPHTRMIPMPLPPLIRMRIRSMIRRNRFLRMTACLWILRLLRYPSTPLGQNITVWSNTYVVCSHLRWMSLPLILHLEPCLSRSSLQFHPLPNC